MKHLGLAAMGAGTGRVALHGGLWIHLMVVSLQGYLAENSDFGICHIRGSLRRHYGEQTDYHPNKPIF